MCSLWTEIKGVEPYIPVTQDHLARTRSYKDFDNLAVSKCRPPSSLPVHLSPAPRSGSVIRLLVSDNIRILIRLWRIQLIRIRLSLLAQQ